MTPKFMNWSTRGDGVTNVLALKRMKTEVDTFEGALLSFEIEWQSLLKGVGEWTRYRRIAYA